MQVHLEIFQRFALNRVGRDAFPCAYLRAKQSREFTTININPRRDFGEIEKRMTDKIYISQFVARTKRRYASRSRLREYNISPRDYLSPTPGITHWKLLRRARVMRAARNV